MNNNLRKKLNRIDVSKCRLKNGNTIEEELKQHAEILAECLNDALVDVYESYTPSVYRRTYGLMQSVEVGDIKVIIYSGKANLSIKVGFNDNAVHTGLDGKDANVAVLLNEGWQHKNGATPYFSYRDGEHFIEKAVEMYKLRVTKPFKVKININGEVTVL